MATEKRCYYVKDAKMRPDGVLCIRTAGLDGDIRWDRIEDISPDSPDYKFWLWLKLRLHRHCSCEDYIVEQAVAKYRIFYEHGGDASWP
jgi:hypothetical protein